jgi:transcriptional regulator with XRE-family HTH domain
MTIGDRLLKLRRERNLSQEDLANELDVSRQTISKWETNQSVPDFDKIVPLCNYFGITTDELLTGNKDIVEAKADNVKSNYARNIAVAVSMYIISLVSIILCAEVFNSPIIGVSLFFTIIAIATGLLIYNGIYYKKESKDEPTTKQKTIISQVQGIVGIIGVIIYLMVSFSTYAWHITWIIFIIVGLVNKIVELIYYLKNNKGEDVE